MPLFDASPLHDFPDRPILPIVFHTGPRQWSGNRTLADLIGGPEELRAFVPEWHVLFWDLAERTPEELLNAAGEFMQVLAVVRAVRSDPETYRDIHAEVLRRLEPLSTRDKMRWRDLVWFVVSWGLQRRPRQERDQLLAAAVASQTDVTRKQQVQTMSETIELTWAEEMMARGEARGELRTLREVLRALLEERFGTLPDDLLQRVDATADAERLKACIRQAVRIRALDELQL